MTLYVVLGNSAAAVGCIEGIRQLDTGGSITVVSSEPHSPYSRPLISYLLEGRTTRERMAYRPADFYEKNGVTPLLGRTALALDPEKKTVRLDDGSLLPYDKLLVATGSRPFVPPMEGLDGVEKAFTFMSLDDAEALEAALTPETRVLIVGAGLIGLKCAEGIRERVKSIDVADLAGRVLPSVLDEAGAARIRRVMEAHGVRFHLGESVKRFEKGAALLTGGETVPFDVLVLAVGVRPNTGLVKEAGGEVRRGIVTDEFGRTSLPEVYAAGDCAESFDVSAEEYRVLALLPNAYRQGECAGLHMAAGSGRAFGKAIPMNAAGFFGTHIITAGSYVGEDWVRETDTAYKRLFVKDGVLKGYILVGDVERAGIYTALIRNRTPLDTIDFELIREKPQLMAFTREERARLLGAVPQESA